MADMKQLKCKNYHYEVTEETLGFHIRSDIINFKNLLGPSLG